MNKAANKFFELLADIEYKAILNTFVFNRKLKALSGGIS
jgi:hypothetical protein